MSNNGQLRVVPSVFTIILKDSKVLLIRRANTKWLDGYYDLPAGHLEDQEHLKDGAARELKEESDLDVQPENLHLVHVYQNHNNPDDPHYGYLFLAEKWTGVPKLMEPDKADDIGFFDLKNLPSKIAAYTRLALENLESDQVTISFHGPGSIDNN